MVRRKGPPPGESLSRPRKSAPRVDTIPPRFPSVLVLGSGAVGSVIARHLTAHPRIGAVTVADVNLSAAQALAGSLGSAKADAIGVDARDVSELADALRGRSVVVNATLPRFNSTVQIAAVEAGANYVDMASESSQPFTRSTLFEAAGLTAVIAMGEDPGLSNIMVRWAADQLTTVESIRVRDGDSASSPEYPFVPLFSPETFVAETLHASRIWEGANYREVPPFGEKEVYSFPAPVGPLPVYSVDHEEVDTLPAGIGKGVRYVDFKLALDESTVTTLRLLGGLPAGSPARAAFLSGIPQPKDLAGKVEGYASVVCEVVGTANGHREQHMLSVVAGHGEMFERHGTTATSYLTGTPAAAVAGLLATGELRHPGVVSPESLEPGPLLRAIRDLGVEVREQVVLDRIAG